MLPLSYSQEVFGLSSHLLQTWQEQNKSRGEEKKEEDGVLMRIYVCINLKAKER